MYVTYDLEQKTRGNGASMYPKVKRVYIAGSVKNWEVGDFQKRSGRKAHGVKIQYQQTRIGYERKGYAAERASTEYEVRPTHVGRTTQQFSQIVEVPEDAQNIQFHTDGLPARYRTALQNIR